MQYAPTDAGALGRKDVGDGLQGRRHSVRSATACDRRGFAVTRPSTPHWPRSSVRCCSWGRLASCSTGRPRGRWVLAYFVVLNQFSRNIHRGSPLAFAVDALALNAAQQLVETGDDATLLPEQRLFAYLPFEHSESLAMQEQSLRLFRALADAHPTLEGLYGYAVAHHKVIAEFGRFPHRNATLGRASTPAELVYLAQPGAGF